MKRIAVMLRDLHVADEVAWAELEVDCPGLSAFRCEVTLQRETFAGSCVVGDWQTRYGVTKGWACPRLLRAFEDLQAQLDGYCDGLFEHLPFETCAVTSAICEEVTNAALLRAWSRETGVGDGFDLHPLLVAPGHFVANREVSASGEIRDGQGYHPAATFAWG